MEAYTKSTSLKDIVTLNDAALMGLLSNNVKVLVIKHQSVVVRRKDFMKIYYSLYIIIWIM